MLSCNFCSSPSTLLSSHPAIVELLDRFTFLLELALYLELPLVFVLSFELELEREDSEIDRDCCLGVSFKASFSSSSFFS